MNLSELKSPAELEDLYHPVMAEIKEVKRLSAMETYYRIELPGGEDLGHVPGQFVELSIFGVGEASFSISSAPGLKGCFELGIRKVGMLTEYLTGLQVGSKIGNSKINFMSYS